MIVVDLWDVLKCARPNSLGVRRFEGLDINLDSVAVVKELQWLERTGRAIVDVEAGEFLLLGSGDDAFRSQKILKHVMDNMIDNDGAAVWMRPIHASTFDDAMEKHRVYAPKAAQLFMDLLDMFSRQRPDMESDRNKAMSIFFGRGGVAALMKARKIDADSIASAAKVYCRDAKPEFRCNLSTWLRDRKWDVSPRKSSVSHRNDPF